MTKMYQIGSDTWNGMSKLVEEMGELHQVCGKLMGNGGELSYWSGDLMPKFIEEIGDVLAALDFFIMHNFTNQEQDEIIGQNMMKLNRFMGWNKDARVGRDFLPGLDHIANFLNSLDTEGMTGTEVRKIIYRECISPTIRKRNMLHKVKGNLIDMAEQGHLDIIVHGCNCLNVMGSGIAKEIKARYPLAFDADTKATEVWKQPVAKLGNFSTAGVLGDGFNSFIIVNAYTQVNYSPRATDLFEYESFYLILRKLEVLAFKGIRIGFPYIGMGLAGGDASRIIPMIEEFAERVAKNGTEVYLVEFGE
jgi:O-acetyl-ADP-ribose deacetylase (regulator of RNase III)/NTP pyrophosphatase (non-canonical NTP hydrolase)